MSDYSETYSKLTGQTINTSEFETEFQAIEAASKTKLDKDSDTATNLTISTGYSGAVITAHASSPFDASAGTETDIPITSIPSWVKRITLIFDTVGCDIASSLRLTIGTGGSPDVTGTYKYTYFEATADNTVNLNALTAQNEIRIAGGYATDSSWLGKVVLTNITGNVWHIESFIGELLDITGAHEEIQLHLNGYKSLSGALDNINLDLSGAGVFNAGQISCHYEG